MSKELTYWLALAHVPKIRTKKKNEIIVKLFEQGKSIVDFFEIEHSVWEKEFELNKTEVEFFANAKKKLSNNILISKGGKAVDIAGNPTAYEIKEESKSIVSEPDLNNTEEKIIEFLKTGVFSAKKIVDILKIDWSSRKVTNFLKSRQDILTVKGKPLKFAHKNRSIQSQKTLFD